MDVNYRNATEEIPQISVIMSVYNQRSKQYLKESIESVLNQSFQDFEFLIYSDGSEPEVVEELRKYAALDKRILLTHNEENKGLAYALNQCIHMARGKYLARMDDDDICTSERFAVQYDFLEQHPEIDFVGSAANLFDEAGIWGVRRYPEYPKERDYLRFTPFIHPSIMMRRSLFLEIEGYRAEKRTWRCEDYDLFLRLWKQGKQGYNIQDALMFYRENKESYKKRKWKYRIEEMKVRYQRFRELDILFPVGWCYVFRPLIAGMVPGNVILGVKKLYHRVTDK